ncbi:MAG TPA: TonB-dependent receptor plug domain-containing protein, partial [Prolixibacteraceae bacterium]|nr:TonB-dependent receptor plug domain-containing protein [Prolixibacteraceae bacterium]
TGERDLLRALAGKVPGLNLVYRDNGTVTLRLRGGTSLDGNDDPLYIVDGAVVDDLSYLNLHDVDKVDVLKDGSIYGTRGANGAIVVTTRN